MSEDKVDLTEDQWKAEINSAFNAGLSMARTIEYHLVMDERKAIIDWLRSCLCATCNENAIGIERIVPPPPREHRCEFPGPAKTFPNGVVWACACGKAWTNYPPPFTSYPGHGWVRSPENDVEADDE